MANYNTYTTIIEVSNGQMQATEAQDQSLPSNQLAEQLIQSIVHPSSSQPKNSTPQLLKMLKNKKNPSHEKFASYIEKELVNCQVDLMRVIEDMRILGDAMEAAGNTEPQMKSVVSGFRRYVFKCVQREGKNNKELILGLIKNYFCYSPAFCSLASELIATNTEKVSERNRQFCQKELFSLIIEALRRPGQSEKCCLIVHSMNLHRYFKVQDLVHMARTCPNSNISYFFKNKKGELENELIEAYIQKQMGSNQGKVKKLIQSLKIDPFQQKEFIKKLNKKCLNYFMTQEPIYALDDKIKTRPDIAECLVEILLAQNRVKEALHFVNKHYLSKYYHLNPTDKRSYHKNVLQKFDQFLPTELILAKCIPSYKTGEYLTLEELGYTEGMVKFLDKQSITLELLSQVSNSPQFGIDCQSTPVFNEYEKSSTQIVQLAVDYRYYSIEKEEEVRVKTVFIIDVQDMIGQPVFRDWLVQLCSGYRGVIVGHTVRKDFQDLVNQIMLGKQVKTDKLNFADIATKFKQKNNETKSSLEYICRTVLHKNISKFEQCSGWNNRPLRKAQLHYAALDAVLPLVINSKL